MKASSTRSSACPKDALVIADGVSRGYYTPYQPGDEVYQRLRILVGNREHWVVEAIRIKNRIARWLDIRFPEYHTLWDDLFGVRSLATLSSFPAPADLTGLSPEQVIQAWGHHIRRPGGRRRMANAVQLLQLARGNPNFQIFARREADGDRSYFWVWVERIQHPLNGL